MQPVDMNKLSTGDGQRTQVEEGQLVGEGKKWTRHRSFANMPTPSWLRIKDEDMGPGVSY